MPNKIKALIEIPAGSNIKYELDEDTHEMVIDRIMPTAMRYPVNYALIHDTLGEDGDALDVLIFINGEVAPNVVINVKLLGVLEMEDEAGVDHKLVAVPATTKIDPVCGAWETMDDIPTAKKAEIKHFFEHYKDLEEGKWVKLKDWQGKEVAEKILAAGRERFKK